MKNLLFYLCLGTIVVYQAPLVHLQEDSTKEVEFPTTLKIEDISVQEEMEDLFVYVDEELERQRIEKLRIEAENKRLAEEAEAKRLAEEERIRKRKSSYL